MRLNRRRLLSVLGAAPLGLLVACAGEARAPATPTPAPATPTLAPTGTPDPAATATATVRRLTLRMPTTEPPTLDPALATDAASVQVVAQLFEGLVELDQSGEPTPAGAASWAIGDDGLTYTFTLRLERRWSDGRPVVAGDYEYAWRRAVDPQTASDYAPLFYPLKNAVRVHNDGLDPQLLGVVARDDRTLVVTLEQHAAQFLRLVSMWTFAPVRKDVVEQFGDRWTRAVAIVTNGPFRLAEWRPDTQIVLERNDSYGGPPPQIVRAVLRAFPAGAADQALSAYESGDLDTLGGGATFEIPPGYVERIASDARARAEVRTYPQSATLFLAVNHRKPHLQDPRVRMALGQAIERKHVLRQVLQRVGDSALALVPEGIDGRDLAAWPAESLDEARAKLADAGFPGGKGFPPLSFAFNTSTQWKQLGEYLRDRYRDTLGIEVKLEPMEWSAFLKWRRGDGWAKDGDLARGGWFSDYEDPYNWYNQIWDSAEDPASFNAGWQNDEYDSAVRDALGQLDRAARTDLYHEADGILAAEYPSIPIFHYGVQTLVRPYVQGFEPERVLALVRLKNVSLGDRP
ncbi:MAG: peptide ABC transporter substrate-binding protein [Chloroflexi bacterium]|nr:peptide ABC transporter substrate-binding protein [Chloroflexota bacterium]